MHDTSEQAMAEAVGASPTTLRKWRIEGATPASLYLIGQRGKYVTALYDAERAAPWLRAEAVRRGCRWRGLEEHREQGPESRDQGSGEPLHGMQGLLPPAREELTRDVTGDTQTLTTRGYRIRTLEEALAFAEVDTAVWEVERYVVNTWEMGYKTDEGEGETIPLHQVKVWLKRRIRTAEVDALEAILARIAEAAPRIPAVHIVPAADPHLLEVSLFDAHFGKLAWRRETGQDYDLAIAETVFERAVSDLTRRAQAFEVEKILFPLGQDFLHVDNQALQTVHGTTVDTDGRYAKVLEAGQEALLRTVDFLLQIAPVDVLLVPGNHDALTAHHMARFLWAYYRQTSEVTVDVEPTSRKYYRYGDTLIGFTHGDEERHQSLPAIMATERPQEWAGTRWHEWHLGHLHKRRVTQHTAVDDHDGVVVRVLPSLSGRDKWHYQKGYLSDRLAEAYLWSRETGPAGYLVSAVRGT
jgi:hypothetical protein